MERSHIGHGAWFYMSDFIVLDHIAVHITEAYARASNSVRKWPKSPLSCPYSPFYDVLTLKAQYDVDFASRLRCLHDGGEAVPSLTPLGGMFARLDASLPPLLPPHKAYVSTMQWEVSSHVESTANGGDIRSFSVVGGGDARTLNASDRPPSPPLHRGQLSAAEVGRIVDNNCHGRSDGDMVDTTQLIIAVSMLNHNAEARLTFFWVRFC
jgi:hypothetical protein